MRVPAAFAVLLLATVMASDALAGDVAVIVHPDRDVRLTAAEVAQIYLRQRRFWGDGERIVPVNRESGSTAREAFVRLVFGQKAPQLVGYWNQQYFQGVLPPATLASDEAVKRFVASEPLAIGYIHPSAVDATVRVVLELEDRRTQEREATVRVARAPDHGVVTKSPPRSVWSPPASIASTSKFSRVSGRSSRPCRTPGRTGCARPGAHGKAAPYPPRFGFARSTKPKRPTEHHYGAVWKNEDDNVWFPPSSIARTSHS